MCELASTIRNLTLISLSSVSPLPCGVCVSVELVGFLHRRWFEGVRARLPSSSGGLALARGPSRGITFEVLVSRSV